MHRRPPLVLAYHGVSEVLRSEDPQGLFTSPPRLRLQIIRLARWGYEFRTFGDFAHDIRPGTVALTFDDGFADNLHELVPVLERTGVPATVFVACGLLGQPHPDHPRTRLLTEEEVRELATHVEIGSHGMHHRDLTSLDSEDLADELVRSRSVLQQLTGGQVDVIAYPFGRTSSTVQAAAAEAGYRAGCGVSGEGSWHQPLHLPRQDMTNGASDLGLRLKRLNWYEPAATSLPGRLVLGAGRWLASR